MNKFKAFLASKDVTTHTVAVVFIAAISAFYAVPQFHTVVMSVYNAMPSTLQAIVVAAFALYAWYRDGSKPATNAPVGK